jgi:hypothetical protein
MAAIDMTVPNVLPMAQESSPPNGRLGVNAYAVVVLISTSFGTPKSSATRASVILGFGQREEQYLGIARKNARKLV